MSGLRALAESVQRELLDLPDNDPRQVLSRHAPLLGQRDRAEVLRLVSARRQGLGAIDELLDDPTINEVMINGPGRVWVERLGSVSQSHLELSRREIDLLIERLVVPIGRRVDQRSPSVDGRLVDGSRVHIVVPPIALDGPYVTIRRFILKDVALQAFGDVVERQLREGIEAHLNIVVSGGTGAGKTTLLNAIAAQIPPGERIVTAEDAAELQLGHPHVVRLETRPESAEGVGLVTMRDVVKNALRMRPDRLVLGEIRGGEAFDLMHALNTGHRGCLSTVHANSPRDALLRLESLAVLGGDSFPLDAVRTQLARVIDLIVHVERGSDGRRVVGEIAEVSPDGGVVTRWRP